jgi:hypothetical protein
MLERLQNEQGQIKRRGLTTSFVLLAILIGLGSHPLLCKGVAAAEKQSNDIQVTWRKISPHGGEEINLILGSELGSARLSRNSNFDSPNSDVVKLGLFSVQNDQVAEAQSHFIRAAARRLQIANPTLDALRSQFPAIQSPPHSAVLLLNGEAVQQSSRSAQRLYQSFWRLVKGAAWQPVDAVEVRAPSRSPGVDSSQPIEVSLRFLGQKSLRDQSLRCPSVGKTLSKQVEWLCQIENYGWAHFYFPIHEGKTDADAASSRAARRKGK